MRRRAPLLLVGLGVVLLLGSYILYTRHVVRDLRRQAERTGRMYARVYDALNDPREDAATTALLDLATHIRESGVPVIVTDPSGQPTAAANLPFDAPLESPRVRAYVAELDRRQPPVVEPGIGTVHYGTPPIVAGLRVIPAVQALMLGLLLLALYLVLRAWGRAERERVWAGTARESAHQLGTPLSSLQGWIELLEEQGGPALAAPIAHMRGDLERLDRVAHRFERIGRPARSESVDVAAVADRVADYFRARVPSLAHVVAIETAREGAAVVRGDPVLIEWAVETIVKNGVDALAGRGGRLRLETTALPEGGVRLRIADDGPGIPREHRARIFEPGFSTKPGGWGIGLALAKRIIEETHRGRLELAAGDRGATFDIILR